MLSAWPATAAARGCCGSDADERSDGRRGSTAGRRSKDYGALEQRPDHRLGRNRWADRLVAAPDDGRPAGVRGDYWTRAGGLPRASPRRATHSPSTRRYVRRLPGSGNDVSHRHRQRQRDRRADVWERQGDCHGEKSFVVIREVDGEVPMRWTVRPGTRFDTVQPWTRADR